MCTIYTFTTIKTLFYSGIQNFKKSTTYTYLTSRIMKTTFSYIGKTIIEMYVRNKTKLR